MEFIVKKDSILRRIFLFIIPLALLMIFIVFPFLWTLLSSIKSQSELFKLTYWPQSPTFQNYINLFQASDFLLCLRNSFIVAFSTMLVTLVITLLGAYAFSRYRFKGKQFFLTMFLTINMFPSVLLLVPLFSIMRNLHILYTPLALILAYATFTIPFSIWMLTGFLNDLPGALEEAAMVDGCNRRSAFLRIILPIAVPGIVATGVYIFINAWNEYTYAVMFTNVDSRTIPVMLKLLVGEFNIDWGLLTAGGIITVLPICVMFVFVQKSLIQGLTAGAVKG
jgi:multiple sugar transport system permease protein